MSVVTRSRILRYLHVTFVTVDMKKLYLFLILSSLNCMVQAQFYRPLHDSVYLQFQSKTVPDFNEPNFAHLYPTFSNVSGGDSVFNVSDHCTGGWFWPLGSQFIKYAQPHQYGFTGLSGTVYYFRTDYTIGTSWLYTNNPPVTATYVDKQLYTFSGVTDSVMVIKLSTDDTIRLSKHYGLCQFKSLFRDLYFTDSLTLVSMSGTPIQQPIYKPLEVFQYQPGEILYYKDSHIQWTMDQYHNVTPNENRSVIKLEVLGKTIIADTVYYDFKWYRGLQFQQGPYSFQLKVTTEEATVVSGTTFFTEIEGMFAPSQCNVNFTALNMAHMNIHKGYDQSTDDDYLYVINTEQGEIKTNWYDTDNGFFQYKYEIESANNRRLYEVIELIVRYPPGTQDTDNLYLTATSDQRNNESLKIFPVPCSDLLTIEGVSLANAKVEITTVSGSTVPSNLYSVSENTITTANLNVGMYILYLKNDSGVSTKMFVKE